MNNRPYLSVIIPTYNEEKRISKTLLSIDQYLSKQTYDYEILVCDGGSKDKTVEVVRNFQKIIKNLRYVIKKDSFGKGYVVKEGMLEAKGKYRLFTDADSSTSIEHLEKMRPYFEKGYEVVIGTRDKRDNKEANQAVPQPFIKRLIGDLGNLLIQLVAVPGIWDTQCGFKAFSEKATKTIFPLLTIEKWGFDIEVLALARKLKYKIGIIPVSWVNDPESKVNLKGYLNTFVELFQIRWNLILNRYKIKN